MKNTFCKIGRRAALSASALMFVFFASCSDDDALPIIPQSSSFTTQRLVFTTLEPAVNTTRAHWSDAKGSGSLLFNWDEDLEGKEVMTIVSDGVSFAECYDTKQTSLWARGMYGSYSFIHPISNEDGASTDATFETVGYYRSAEVENYKYVHMVTPFCDEEAPEVSNTHFGVKMTMPGTFVQPTSKDPTFLRNYMMMYASAPMSDGTANLEFQKLATTFRFIIANQRATEVTIKGVKVEVSDNQPVGSKYVQLKADAEHSALSVEYMDADVYSEIVTNFVDAKVPTGETYTGYAMALPLSSNDAFKDRSIKFIILTEEDEYLAYELSGSTLASANVAYGEDMYNWTPRTTYTIRMYLTDELSVKEFTVSSLDSSWD